MPDFVKPDNLIGTFGVIRLWPGVENAEVEVNARLKVAARKLGLNCIEITADGMLASSPKTKVNRQDVDFVIHLHFETPKAYDLFSFAALWNPLQFFFDYVPGNYRNWSNNLLSHDDFLSCSSTGADDHIKRLIINRPKRLPPQFTLYHSLANPIIAPKIGKKKIFYAGINHERLGKGKSRHQELLDMLDTSGDLLIYGPRIFLGVQVWEGYRSYVGPLPFDGVSVVKEIAAAGIVLALSSEAHKDSELMSNRLFEGLAGGAIIIADENPFARRHFGETLLYIDSSLPAAEINSQIRGHLRWIEQHPKDALELAQKAQAIFKERFTLDQSLAAIYEGFHERRAQLEHHSAGQDEEVRLFFLMPDYNTQSLSAHINSLSCQTHSRINATLLVDEADYQVHKRNIDSRVAKSSLALTIQPINFYKNYHSQKGFKPRPLGQIVFDIISKLTIGERYCFVEPGETLFSNHISSLLDSLLTPNTTEDHLSQPPTAVAATLLINDRHNSQALKLKEGFSLFEAFSTESLGRFLLQKQDNFEKYKIILPYLNRKVIQFLAFEGHCTNSRCVTTSIEVYNDSVETQNDIQIIMDYMPDAIWTKPSSNHQLASLQEMNPVRLSLENMPHDNKLRLIHELFYSLPISPKLQRLIVRTYRVVKRKNHLKKA